jgi:hypothetical protein
MMSDSFPAKVGTFLRRPKLLHRFPVLGPYRSEQKGLHYTWSEERFPLLKDRIATAREQIDPAFAEADDRALKAQNRERRQRVGMIVGSLLVTGFAAAQASFTATPWIGVVVATLAAATAAMTAFIRQEGSLHTYVSERRKAERLRSLSFRYVTQPKPEDKSPEDHLRELQHTVASIRYQNREEG